MEESWGLKNLLDRADDVAMLVVSVRDEKVLYCNHFVAMNTRLHPGTKVSDNFKEWSDIRKELGDSMSGRYILADTPFGRDRNITLTRMVWTNGVQAIGILSTPHRESGDQEETKQIFKSLGESYEWMFVLDGEKNEVKQVLKPKEDRFNLYQPIDFDEWKRSRYFHLIHPDDEMDAYRFFELGEIFRKVAESNGRYNTQYRRKFGEQYHWVECTIRRMEGLGDKKVVVTEKDIQGELTMTQKNSENELIMTSLSNIYRSIYLLDLVTGSYQVVKPDELLFGISGKGDYQELLDITSEMIPDENQKKDLKEYFSIEALKGAYQDGMENIGREYKSVLSKVGGWMSINAFKPPHRKNMENKCVITFTDITEHKRVEAERNEKTIALDVLSSRYVALFFTKAHGSQYHSIKIPEHYAYLEKTYPNIMDAFKHYTSAYVLEPYRETFRHALENVLAEREEIGEETVKKEYIYRNIDNDWIRLNIFMIPRPSEDTEIIIAMEDYNDIMEQHALSVIYNETMLNDYEVMYEYDPQNDYAYQLTFDGERLVRVKEETESEPLINIIKNRIHPDERDMFMEACSLQTTSECLAEGKTVTHMYFRRQTDGEYRSFMYGFHYFDEMGSPRVMIMVRDAEKELM